MMFRSIDQSPALSFGVDANGLHRIGGDWVETQPLTENERVWLSSVAASLHALPRWPLADGLDLSVFKPDTHQLAVADKLASCWLDFIDGLENRYPRTRVVVADEGGIGKTLSVSVAVRWITLREHAEGPILVLVPPLLTEHWASHLRAVFSDDPDRIRVLSSARFFDPELHKEDIIVVSKFSWIHHMQDRQVMPNSLCVVIDEAHQGRTGMGFNNLDHVDFEEEGLGEIYNHDEIFSTKQHAKILQQTTQNSKFAIAVTATPINTNMDELNYILNNICSEESEHRFTQLSEDRNERWFDSLRKIKHWARTSEDSLSTCPIGMIEELIECIEEGLTPTQWEMLAEDDKANVVEWLRIQLTDDSCLTPSLALTLVREFHPYGRHLSMILRTDLRDGILDRDGQKFRSRIERRVDLSYDENLSHFMSSIRRDGKDVALDETLTGPARLIASYHMNPQSRENEKLRYSGNWFFREDSGLDWKVADAFADPRIDMMLMQIQADISNSNVGDTSFQRGCVVFTEFRGTIKFLQKRLNQCRNDIEEVTLTPLILTGDTNIHEARKILNQCRTKSSNKRFYPVLICTPAGEVGLDMEWATSLIHWDLNPNPQRLEQRTWRLDRRISNNHTNPTYTVLFPMLTDVPHYDELENRIVDRFNKANHNLFNPSRPYIPEDNQSINLTSSGSHHNFDLLSDEIRELNRFLHEEGDGGWPGPQLRQSERLRLSSIFDLTRFSFIDNTILQEGKTSEFPTYQERIQTNDCRVAAVRDFEVLSPALSRAVSPHLPPRSSSQPLVGHWELGGDHCIRLPNTVLSIKNLFRSINWKVQPSLCPLIRMNHDSYSGNFVLAVNPDLAGRDLPLSPKAYDRGLRLYSLDDDEPPESMDEKEEWSLKFSLLSALVTDHPAEWVHSPDLPNLIDPVGYDHAQERLSILQARQESQTRHVNQLKKKLETIEDEDRRKRFESVIELSEGAILSRNEIHDEIGNMSHNLIVVAQFNLG